MEESRLFLSTFLRGLPEGAFAYLWTRNAKTGRKYTRWYASVEDMIRDAESQKVAHDVYVGMALSAYGRGSFERVKNEDAYGIMGLWIDLDFGKEGHKKDGLPADEDEAMDMIADLPEPTIVVNSGNGLHVYWLFDEPLIVDEEHNRSRESIAELARRWNNYVGSMAAAKGFQFDAVFDLARVLRVAGTLNHKTDPAKTVQLVICEDERRYKAIELWKLCESFEEDLPTKKRDTPSKRIEKVEVGELIVDSRRGLSFKKWQALFDNNGKFKKTWNRRRQDIDESTDSSSSVYEQALICFMVEAGWTDQEIVDAVTAWRETHKLDPVEKEVHYFQHSIGKARGLLVEGASEGVEVDEAETKEQRLDRVSRWLNIRVLRIIQYEAREPVYHMETDRGLVIIGGANQLINQLQLRTKLATKQRLLPLYAKERWQMIAQEILNCVDVVEIPEASITGETADLIEHYLTKVQIMESAEDADENRLPFRKDGRVYLHFRHFRAWVAENETTEKFARGDLAVMLETFGARQIVVAIRDETKKSGKSSRNVWLLPERVNENESEKSEAA